MSDETVRLVCMSTRNGDAYVPGSVVRHCYACNEPLWVSPASMAIAASLEFVCTGCAPHAMHDLGDYRIAPPTPEQLREVRRYL